MKKFNIALVGYGMSGRQFHLPAFFNHPSYNVKLVQTRNEKNQMDLKAICPSARIVFDYNEILNDDNIDLVVITASNDTHYSYSKQALLKGKHVVCEKPFVETYEEAKELFKLAEEKNLILRVFHNRKYDGDILTIKELMKTRDFGKLLTFSVRFDRYRPEIGDNWRFKVTTMSGLFYDLAPHLTHHVISLFGLPNSVFLNLFYEREASVADDHFELILYYDNLVAFIGAEMFEREARPRFHLVGTKASYVKYGYDNPDSVNVKAEDLYQNSGLRSIFKTSPNEEEDIPLLRGQHYRFYDLLADHLNNGVADDEDKRLALAVIQVMDKAMKSYQAKQIINI
jgi:scyllo-inositol 2-dehydrogenase (NADP+)